MRFDCKVSLGVPNAKHKYVRGKVGIGQHNNQSYLLIATSTSTSHERLRVASISKPPFASKSRPLITINFSEPNKELSVECESAQDVKMLHAALNMLRHGKSSKSFQENLPTLDKLTANMKMKPTPTAMNVTRNNFDPKELCNQSLTVAKFVDSKIVPSRLFKLTKLTELHLINCALTQMPDELSQLHATLTTLNVSKNAIKAIPGHILSVCGKLAHLNVSHNVIDSVPLEIVLAKQLTTLNLAHNELKKIPLTLATLNQLKDLNISHNQLQFLPHYFMRPLNPRFRLVTFDFSGNRSNTDFNERLNDWPTASGGQVPRLMALAASASLKSIKNLRFLSTLLPAEVYDYLQKYTYTCLRCRRPFSGPKYIAEIRRGYYFTQFAQSVLSDAHSSALPVVAFHCYRCAV